MYHGFSIHCMNVKYVLGVIMAVTLVTTPIVQQAEGGSTKFNGTDPIPADRRAPLAITGDNVYVALHGTNYGWRNNNRC